MSSHVHFSRRQALAGVAGLALSATFAPLFAAPAKRHFKIGACEWSLGKRDPSCFEVAKEIGLDGVQVDLGNPGDKMRLTHSETQTAYVEAARKSGLEISSLAIAEMNQTPLKSDPRAAQWVHDSVDACKELGVSVVLLAFFFKGDFYSGDYTKVTGPKEVDKAAMDKVVEILKREAPRAEEAGVIFGVESWLNAEQHLEILDRVNSKAVMVYYDVGNMHVRGYDIYQEIRQLKGKICEFHAKDHNNLFGKGQVDFAKVRAAMDDTGYRGWIQIEGATPLGMKESYKQDLAYLKSVFPADA
jgi:L-ribulose-5-phosphate 3-epimerase